MANTRGENILIFLAAALNGAGKPPGLTVNRARRRPLDNAELPMMSLYPVREEVARATSSRTSPTVERTLRVQVRCRAVGQDAAVDPLRAWAVKAVMADRSLAGLALATTEDSIEWESDDASDADYAIASVDFLIRYTTNAGDLEKKQ
ncbi:hypothetical protein LCGC14_1627390 [marine sediment metagenome]|uniref:Uncharacterized protein n=1 Tax=marine sediment metagenome TaxID=412755 RepID=A0A0F9IQP6_9ZZZZ